MLTIPVLSLCSAPILAASVTLTNVADIAHALAQRTPPKACFSIAARVNDMRLSPENGSARKQIRSVAVDDASGFVVVEFRSEASELKNGTGDLSEGDIVKLVGLIDPSYFGEVSAAVATSYKVLSKTNACATIRASFHDIMSGALDYKPASINCQIRDAALSETCPDWVILKTICNDELLDVSVATPTGSDGELTALVGAAVEIKGIVTPYDYSLRKKMGRIFWCWSQRNIRVLTPPPSDKSDVPEISTLRDTHPSAVIRQPRHKVFGRVLAVWQKNNVLLRTGEGDICRVELTGTTTPVVGDDISCIGFPESDLYHINLMRATWTRTSHRPLAEKQVADRSVEDLMVGPWNPGILNMSNHGCTIRMTGEVCSLPSTYNASVLYLKVGESVLRVDTSAGPQALDGLSVRCRIAVTGVCVIETPNWSPNAFCQKLDQFLLVIRSPDDIKVLSRPSCWTPTRLMIVSGILLLVLVAIVIWNRSLSVLAERRGRLLLREQIGHVRANLKVDERTRLAVDLHDSLSQNLTGISLQLDLVDRLAGNANPEVARHLDIAGRTLQSCRNELRGCIWDLRSQALDATSLDEAIRMTLRPHLDATRLALRFPVPRKALDDNTTHALLRIIRELVSNALRHGEAKSVRIAGKLENNQLLVSVQDDGNGFDPDVRPNSSVGHFGLDGIRERLRHFHGKLSIESAPRHGCKVVFTIALPENTEQNRDTDA